MFLFCWLFFIVGFGFVVVVLLVGLVTWRSVLGFRLLGFGISLFGFVLVLVAAFWGLLFSFVVVGCFVLRGFGCWFFGFGCTDWAVVVVLFALLWCLCFG